MKYFSILKSDRILVFQVTNNSMLLRLLPSSKILSPESSADTVQEMTAKTVPISTFRA